MNTETGQISVTTENIFPIIKKFLYSDHEIFLRELISNAVDATIKLKKLASIGEINEELGDLTIEVKVDKKNKTLTISDKGIGMTADEVKKYINQIAFSGAKEFLEKFEGKDENEIIGKFGLGFYSAFMVARKVVIITRSWKKDSEAVRWECEGNTEYKLYPARKSTRGTDVILYIDENSEEFLEEERIEGLLKKYCKFLPVEIKFGTRKFKVKDKDGKEKEVEKDYIINNTKPAWTIPPSQLTDKDYIDFYRELYPDSFEDPLFWIHLNVDYPFHLTGILYFPKINNYMPVQKNKIQLYCRQVFITDSVEGIVPEYLMLLHGVIDSPDIPLNVSRSYLQSDPNVKKISSYISRKVAEKLEELFKNDRDAFIQKWKHIETFVKFGMISDEKFFTKAINFCLFKNIKDEYFTLDEYKEKIAVNQTDRNKLKVVLYTNDPDNQHAFIEQVTRKGYDVLVMDNILDNHFIQQLEIKNNDLRFKRVDADSPDKLIEKDEKIESVLTPEQEKKLEELFKEKINDESITIVTRALSPEEPPVLITQSEFFRRMKEMSRISGQGDITHIPENLTLIINTNHPMARKILNARSNQEKLIQQMYDLALLSQNMLKGEKLSKFVERTLNLIG